MSPSDWVEKDFYKVLGVSKEATADEIKKAYRKLARENHPDSNPGDAAAEERFKEISEAYSVLSDPTQRKEYDERAPLFGGGGFRGPRRAAAARLLTTSARRRTGGVRRPRTTCSAASSAAVAGLARAPPARSGRRDGVVADVRPGDRGAHRLAAAGQRRGLPDLCRHRRQGRHRAARLPELRGLGHADLERRRGLLDDRAVPRVPGSRARRRRPVPDLPRLRPGCLQPDHLGPDPGRRAATASGSGCAARAAPASTAGPTVTSTSWCTSARTGSSVARATT